MYEMSAFFIESEVLLIRAKGSFRLKRKRSCCYVTVKFLPAVKVAAGFYKCIVFLHNPTERWLEYVFKTETVGLGNVFTHA